jgi:hypothetical protein
MCGDAPLYAVRSESCEILHLVCTKGLSTQYEALSEWTFLGLACSYVYKYILDTGKRTVDLCSDVHTPYSVQFCPLDQGG